MHAEPTVTSLPQRAGTYVSADWHAVMTGRGRPLVCIHGGLGLDHSYLLVSLEPLAGIARLVFPDLRGNGRTPPPARWDGFGLVEWAKDLDALRQSLGLPRWTMLGHSLGSFVALEYALRFQEHLDALVLVSSCGAFDHAPTAVEGARARGTPEMVENFLAAFSSPVPDNASFAATWENVLPLYFHRWNDRYRTAFRSTRYSAEALNASLAGLAQFDVRQQLDRINVPTLVVSGDDDFITPAELGRALANGIEGARHTLIPASGHFPFLESPAEFNDSVRTFLEALSFERDR